MACKKDHKNLSDIMNSIPTDQGGIERHKCAACAYEKGLTDEYDKLSKELSEQIELATMYSLNEW